MEELLRNTIKSEKTAVVIQIYLLPMIIIDKPYESLIEKFQTSMREVYILSNSMQVKCQNI